MIEKLYKRSPHFLQNIFITGYNVIAYRSRYGNSYYKYLSVFKDNAGLSLADLKSIQNKRFLDLIRFAKTNSPFYKSLFENIDMPQSIEEIQKLPIVDKEMLRKNAGIVHTIDSAKAIHFKTGGTTGKSLEVFFTPDNVQERFAMLDAFRSKYGYKLGKKTAWFSGKTLLTHKDIRKNRFWKTDYLYNVRYYSTFHIKREHLNYYVENIFNFQPQYIVGFPSNILEIAKHGLKNGIKMNNGAVQAIFPTAETITPEMREVIEDFFNAKMYNQYASSEGASFIFECSKGALHLELQSGVFEVLDEYDNNCTSGRLVVTSFTTKGTPLIRYDIGDQLVMEATHKKCRCGNNNPLVKEILGRIDDFVYSPENGKINLGNVSNTLKNTKGIVRFQAIQNELEKIILLVEIDNDIYNNKIENKFIENWRERVGQNMVLEITHVDHIPVEKSGKYRIVKNNI